jgi:hypothetical protein
MCNLYSITTNQTAIIALFRVINRYIGNLAPMLGVFPDHPVPVIRNTQVGSLIAVMRWGMLPPPRMRAKNQKDGISRRITRLLTPNASRNCKKRIGLLIRRLRDRWAAFGLPLQPSVLRHSDRKSTGNVIASTAKEKSDNGKCSQYRPNPQYSFPPYGPIRSDRPNQLHSRACEVARHSEHLRI